MNEKTYEINVNLDNYYKNYLIINRPVIDSILTKINKKHTKITDKLMKMLERLLFYNFHIAYKNPGLNKSERWKLLMDTEIKQKICDDMGLKDIKRVNTHLSRLRKIGVIDSQGISDHFEIFPKDTKIIYKIQIHAK